MQASCHVNPNRRLNVRISLAVLHTVLVGSFMPVQASDVRDIYASAEYGDFVSAIAIPTALAETQEGDFVKFIQIGKNQKGELVVRGIALLSIGEHAPATSLNEGADVIVIAHVHPKLMDQRPTGEDARTVRRLGVPNFVISADGRLVWEVGIVSGRAMYREISPRHNSQWKTLE
jgi:hypothetical protein